jgi:stringent starvation protein B
MAETSTKPYMIRALYEWCCDNGYTPYLAVSVDAHTIVPRQHVKNGEIVLNVSPMATSRLSLGNDLVEFQARFSGVAQQISIPIGNVSAIYARETGHGMAFDVALESGADDEQGIEGAESDSGSPGGAETGQHGAEGGPSRLQAVPEDGGHHTQGSTVQSLRGGARRRGPRSLTAEDTADTSVQGAETAHAGGGPDDVASIQADHAGEDAGKVKGQDGGDANAPENEAGATPGTARRRSAKAKGSADVIAFAPSGGAAKKKAADKAADKAAGEAAGEAGSSPKPQEGKAAPADAPSGHDDEDPPPNEGGAGKSGKARLTRVK